MAPPVIDDGAATNFTPTVHRTPYPGISPLLPSLSQAGKTVLITGGGTGIGKASAHAFLRASAATIIIIGRRLHKLTEAAGDLEAAGKELGKEVRVIAKSCDVTDDEQVKGFWEGLEKDGVYVDVLVLNSAITTAAASMFDIGVEAVWKVFEANVKGPLHFAELFYKQSSSHHTTGPKYLVNVSSAVIHMQGYLLVDMRPTYSLTKNSGTLAIQILADSIAAEDMQVLSFHPGAVYGAVWEEEGVPEDAFPFDDANLPGSFAVWAATPAARFLHGRFVWSAWDVEELASKETIERLEGDRDYLKISVKGLQWGKKI